MHAPAIESLPSYVCRLDVKKLQPGVRHYNPSVCKHDGRLLLAYRVQDYDGASRVGIATLHKRLYVQRDTAIEIPDADGAWIEDPRLCVVGDSLVLLVVQIQRETPARTIAAAGGLSLSIADATDGSAPEGFLQRAFVLDGETLQPVGEIPLPFGRNGRGKHEKNWIPFELPDGELGIVYQMRPHQVVYRVRTGDRFVSEGIRRWRWGTVSGRTPAIRLGTSLEDPYIALIGGHVPHPSRNSLYWVGAVMFRGVAPYDIIGVSREPILWGSERSPALLNLHAPSWNPVCVFPAGLIEEKPGQLLVSVGTNDSWCDFLRYSVDELVAGMVRPEELTGDERILAAPGAAAISGEQVRVRVVCRQPIGEPGGPYFQGEEFFTSAATAAALGPKKVQVLR